MAGLYEFTRNRSRRRPRFQWGMRRVALTVSAIAGLLGALCFAVAWHEYRTISMLRDGGVLAHGKFLRVVDRESRNSRGFSVSTSHGIWAFEAGGRKIEVQDDFRPEAAPSRTTPRLGPSATGQIVYLPDKPTVARMRNELSLELLPYLATGGMFLLIALASGGGALIFLRRPGRINSWWAKRG